MKCFFFLSPNKHARPGISCHKTLISQPPLFSHTLIKKLARLSSSKSNIHHRSPFKPCIVFCLLHLLLHFLFLPIFLPSLFLCHVKTKTISSLATFIYRHSHSSPSPLPFNFSLTASFSLLSIMAFSLYPYSSINPTVIPLLLVLFLALCSIPATSTSRKAVENYRGKNHQITARGFKVSLKHVDHGKNLTSLQRLQRGIKRGKQRLQRLNALSSSDSSSEVESPVNAGNGEFLMELAIGTPPLAFSAIMDTGSDLIWTQCSPCKDCFKQSTAIFDPKKSSSFSKLPCSSLLCKAIPSSTCSDGCEYYYAYGDYSSTQGLLATETFTFGDSETANSIPKIGFGCGEDNEGDGFNQGAGLVGLGRGALSLVSQLKEPKFSYCLNSIDDSKSSSLLLLGSLANANSSASSKKIKTTPLVQNPSQPSFYYLSLQGITVGGNLLPIGKDTFALHEDGSGGLIIDSGTTISYLEESAYDEVRKAFASKINLPIDDSGAEGLDLCFKLPSDSSSQVEVPKLIFHFDGADLDLPPENYVLVDSDLGLLCLAMGASDGMSILGNFQQQNTLVLHDLEKETLSFIPTKCDGL